MRISHSLPIAATTGSLLLFSSALRASSIPAFPEEPLNRYAGVRELVIQDTQLRSEFVLGAAFRLKPRTPFTLTHVFGMGDDWTVMGTLSVSGDIVKGEFLHLTELRYFHNNAPHGEPPFSVAFNPIFNIGAGSGQFADIESPDGQFNAFGTRSFSISELHPGAPHTAKDEFKAKVSWTARGKPATEFGDVGTFNSITVRFASAHAQPIPEPSTLILVLSGLGAGLVHQLRRPGRGRPASSRSYLPGPH